jgi:S-DNA-T family DNA segregation ATPase FtsK/SpoIIIE
VELAPPEKKEERSKGELIKVILPPLTMMLVTVGGAVMMGSGLFVLISSAGTLLTLVFSVTTFLGERRTHLREEKDRDEAYDTYLLGQRKKIHELFEAQRSSLRYHNLSPAQIAKEIESYSSRLYERAANEADFLMISLGSSTVNTSFIVKYDHEADVSTTDPLSQEMHTMGASYQAVPDMPTVVDLKRAHLGLVGEPPYIRCQLVSILTQICFYHSYHDIEVILLVDEETRPAFEWVRWYPHCRVKAINVTGLISGENQRDQVLGNLAQIFKARRQKQDEDKKDAQYLPHYVFIVANPKLIINHSIMEYLQAPDTTLGFSIVYTTNIQANLPENIRTVFTLDGGDRGTLVMNEGSLLNTSVVLPEVEDIDVEIMARRLTAIRHSQGVSTVIPDNVTFFELYGVERPQEIPILQRWENSACHKSLAVPLGLRGKDDIVSLNLHEKAHGPHGLVAGTTGSGKSEIVQSYILSLAVNFHPHEVGFLLIDYKGGGMANLFADLPHLLGTITNLDGGESMRALASIRSENARRQRIFAEHDVNNINNYTKLFQSGEAKIPLPHLFIISDEFAELKKEQPDFMSELVSVARIGRSLGVHLILATQKPSGVVDDQIWSNSRFKLALKVADESDSNEVLKTPDAARITQPGRAYLQVGNNEIYELFQSAWSGAPYSEQVAEQGFDSRVYLINQLGQGELLNDDLSAVDTAQGSTLTQLDVVVSHTKAVYEKLGAVTVDRPWLPPLPKKLVTSSIGAIGDVSLLTAMDVTVPIGLVDIPESQMQAEYVHDFVQDGNLGVFGAPGFGKSTVLMTTALTLACRNSPTMVNFFILDYGNSTLVQLRGLPHTADYLGIDDTEKLDKLVKFLGEELKRRKSLFAGVNALNFTMYNETSDQKLPAIMVVVDNFDVVREASPDLEDFLVKLTRDGTGVGVYTIISASRSNAVRYAVLNNFKNKVALFMFDPTDVTAIVGRCDYKLPEVRGRAMVKTDDTHVLQCYLPVEHTDDITYATLVGDLISNISEQNTAPSATGVRVLPETITYQDLIPYQSVNTKQIVAGFDIESTDPTYFDLSIAVQMIIGGPTTGKTNILKLVLAQFTDARCFIVDSRAGDLQDFEDQPGVVYMGSASQLDEFHQQLSDEVSRRQEAFQLSGQRIKDFIASELPILVLIDDGDNFVEICKAKSREMEKVILEGIDLGLTFFITTLPSKMRGYDDITLALKDTQSGIVLGDPGDQNILSVSYPSRYRPMSDVGFWFKRGDTRQIKIPFIR